MEGSKGGREDERGEGVIVSLDWCLWRHMFGCRTIYWSSLKEVLFSWVYPGHVGYGGRGFDRGLQVSLVSCSR